MFDRASFPIPIQYSCSITFRTYRRIKIFNDIPWRSVLTTNYDLCLSGPTPKCPDVGDAYISSLRQGNKRIGEQLTEKINAPVVKLHGCVNRGNIVFTRSGYRELLYRNSGYKVFLQSLMASHTFVSIGHRYASFLFSFFN